MKLLVGSDNVDRSSEPKIWDAALDQVRVVVGRSFINPDDNVEGAFCGPAYWQTFSERSSLIASVAGSLGMMGGGCILVTRTVIVVSQVNKIRWVSDVSDLAGASGRVLQVRSTNICAGVRARHLSVPTKASLGPPIHPLGLSYSPSTVRCSLRLIL